MEHRKASRRQFLQWSAVATGSLALAACAAPAPASTDAADTASASDDQAMAEALDLTLLSLKGTGWPEFNNLIIDTFMEQSGHNGTLQEVQWPIRDTLIPAIAAGTPPDVVHDMGKMSGALYIEGAYLTLNDLLDASPHSADDFISADIEALTFFGEIKKIPFWHNGVPNGFFIYRKDFLDEAGISHPATHGAFESYAELFEWTQKLQIQDASGNITRWGWDHIGTSWSGFPVLGGVLDQGSHWWDEGAGQFTINTEEMANTIQTIYLDPVYTYGVSYDNANEPEVARNERLFEGVVAAQQFTWPILIAYDKEMYDMVELIGYSEIPGMAPGSHEYGYEGTWGAGIVASSQLENHEAAFQLATMQLQSEIAQAIMTIAGPPSALKSFGEDPWLDELAAKHNAGAVSVANLRRDIEHPPTFSGWEWMDGQLMHWLGSRCADMYGGAERCGESGVGHIFDGRVTAQQIAEEWQAEATRIRAELRKAAGLDG